MTATTTNQFSAVLPTLATWMAVGLAVGWLMVFRDPGDKR